MAPEAREYHEFFRGIRRSALRGAVAAIAILAIYFGVAAAMGGWVVPAIVAAGFPEARLPLSFLTIAAVLPFVFLVQRVCFGISERWLHSVAGRFRWAVAGRAALVVVPAFALLGAADWVLDGAAAPPATSLAMGAAILLALLIAPLQSMAEEYLFRGLLTRSVATWFGPSIVSLAMSLLVTAVLFAAFHGTADPWRLAFYLAFGVAASLITWRTGGLESASVMHAANNLAAIVVTVWLAGDHRVADPDAAGSPRQLLGIAVCAIVTAGIWIVSSRAGDQRRAGEGAGGSAISSGGRAR